MNVSSEVNNGARSLRGVLFVRTRHLSDSLLHLMIRRLFAHPCSRVQFGDLHHLKGNVHARDQSAHVSETLRRDSDRCDERRYEREM
jgi:hypothetical protein